MKLTNSIFVVTALFSGFAAHADLGVFSPEGNVTAISYNQKANSITVRECTPRVEIESAAACVTPVDGKKFTISAPVFTAAIQSPSVRREQVLSKQIEELKSRPESAEIVAKRKEVAKDESDLSWAQKYGKESDITTATQKLAKAKQELETLTAVTRNAIEKAKQEMEKYSDDVNAFGYLQNMILSDKFTVISTRNDNDDYQALTKTGLLESFRIASLTKEQVISETIETGTFQLTSHKRMVFGNCSIKVDTTAIDFRTEFSRDGKVVSTNHVMAIPSHRITAMGTEYDAPFTDFVNSIQSNRCY